MNKCVIVLTGKSNTTKKKKKRYVRYEKDLLKKDYEKVCVKSNFV